MAASLPAVLEGIWAAQIPLAERRRLCARTASVLVLGAHVDTENTCSSVVAMEEALHAVADRAGKPRINIVDAKDWLRQHGGATGKSLASRLAKLSKARNVAAHPDTSLVGDIRACQHVTRGADPSAVDAQHLPDDVAVDDSGITTDGAEHGDSDEGFLRPGLRHIGVQASVIKRASRGCQMVLSTGTSDVVHAGTTSDGGAELCNTTLGTGSGVVRAPAAGFDDMDLSGTPMLQTSRPPKSVLQELGRGNRTGGATLGQDLATLGRARKAVVDETLTWSRPASALLPDTSPTRGSPDIFKAHVITIYVKHNQAKLGEVDSILASYKGRERELFFKVCNKYRIDPATVLDYSMYDELTSEQAHDIADRLGVRSQIFGQ